MITCVIIKTIDGGFQARIPKQQCVPKTLVLDGQIRETQEQAIADGEHWAETNGSNIHFEYIERQQMPDRLNAWGILRNEKPNEWFTCLSEAIDAAVPH